LVIIFEKNQNYNFGTPTSQTDDQTDGQTDDLPLQNRG